MSNLPFRATPLLRGRVMFVRWNAAMSEIYRAAPWNGEWHFGLTGAHWLWRGTVYQLYLTPTARVASTGE